jgi:rSAM/selenodomain-associated transferase 2
MAVLQDRAAVVAEPLAEPLAVSIIIPVLNEASCLDQSLNHLFAQRFVNENCEVIICDGGSHDDSLAIAGRYACRIVHSGSGRAVQMNRGADLAQGQQLLFLHADSHLPQDLDQHFPQDADWGFFRIHLDHRAIVFRIIETAINLRSRITRVAGGDQGLFFKRDFFQRLGGFPTIPLMEDIAICKSARRLKQATIVQLEMHTSSRRWQQRGVIKTILLMWSLRFAYWLGVDPVRLHRFYYPQRG